MKHVIATEFHAKKMYKMLMNKKHKDIKYQDPGMTILATHPFISVTPDLEIDCACHGPGLVEIKCPASLIGKVPQKDNYKHLEARECENKLRKSSEYYFQLQGQMAVTKRNYCDFFVFTTEGYHLERIKFDNVCWTDMLHNLSLFWTKFVAPEILFGRLEQFNSLDLCKIPKPVFGKDTNTDIEINDDLTQKIIELESMELVSEE